MNTKKPRYTYGRDGTVPSNNYDDHSSDSTATLEKPTTVLPYVFEPRSELPKAPEPSQDTSEFDPARRDSTREDDMVQLVGICLQRAKEYVAKNDPMQASEKLYKTTEEAIKFLAEYYKLSELDDARREGQWWTELLARTAKSLTRMTGKEELDEAWVRAFDLHVHGFHENAYSIKDVEPVISVIEKLVNYVLEVNDARRKSNP